MLVRQLVGRFAGQVVEMPFVEAQNCLAAGTFAIPGEEPVVRGMELTAEGPAAAEPGSVVDEEEAPVAAAKRRGRRG